MEDLDDPIGFRDAAGGAEQQAIDDGENRGRGADPDGERQRRGEGKDGIAPKNP